MKNIFFTEHFPGAVPYACSVEKGLLKSFEKFTENEKRLQNWCFPVNRAKCLGTPILEHLLTSTSDYFWTAFSVQARIKTNKVARITHNVNMFEFSEYDDSAASCKIKKLCAVLGNHY